MDTNTRKAKQVRARTQGGRRRAMLAARQPHRRSCFAGPSRRQQLGSKARLFVGAPASAPAPCASHQVRTVWGVEELVAHKERFRARKQARLRSRRTLKLAMVTEEDKEPKTETETETELRTDVLEKSRFQHLQCALVGLLQAGRLVFELVQTLL